MKYQVIFRCYHYNTGGSPPNNHYYDEIKEFETLEEALDLKALVDREMNIGDGNYYEIEDGFVASTADIQIKSEFIPVKLLQDESSHWYIVPQEFADDFNKQMNYIYDHEDDDGIGDVINEFEDKFNKYRTGGSPNSYQLYISQDELKKLTNE